MFKRFKVIEDTNYTKVSNQFVRDEELSLKAKGLMLVIMSLPEDWDFSVSGLVTVVKESKNTIYGIINELKDRGYCKTETIKRNNLTIDTRYEFYESLDQGEMKEYKPDQEEKIETCISRTKPGQYITVPVSVVEDRKITGNELLVYSLILGFNQHTHKEFRGSINYIHKCTGVSRETVFHVLKRLVQKGHLKKRELYVNGTKYCLYTAIQGKATLKAGEEDGGIRSDDYIRLFLTPGKTWRKRMSLREKMSALHLDEFPEQRDSEIWKEISKYINGMDYQEFLKTKYWKAISEKIKDTAGHKCAICNSTEKLEVHHKTYEHHGSELTHPEDLICLCHTCHSRIHNK